MRGHEAQEGDSKGLAQVEAHGETGRLVEEIAGCRGHQGHGAEMARVGVESRRRDAEQARRDEMVRRDAGAAECTGLLKDAGIEIKKLW